MDEPGKVETVLLPVVVSDEIERLHVVGESREYEAERKSVLVLFPRGFYHLSVFVVHREVVLDNMTFRQIVDVHVLFKVSIDDVLDLTSIELFEHVGGKHFEVG